VLVLVVLLLLLLLLLLLFLLLFLLLLLVVVAGAVGSGGLICTWQGMSARAWMAWHCVNRYGCAPPAVCSGDRNWMALDVGAVANRTPMVRLVPLGRPGGRETSSGVPRTACASPKLHARGDSSGTPLLTWCTPDTERPLDVSRMRERGASSDSTVAVSVAYPSMTFREKSTSSSKCCGVFACAHACVRARACVRVCVWRGEQA
jgi:hypothetical protein